jgi:N-acetylglucosaminyl-diphospho-decaprenol L-rhamnosyltransferase
VARGVPDVMLTTTPTLADITLVVIAFHRPELVARTLANLADASDLSIMVMNVDADPAVAAAVGRHPRHRPAVTVDIANLGYAAAVNRAAALATTRFLVFTNDDILIDSDALARLVDTVRTGRADVAMPRLVDPAGADEGTVRALPTPARIALEFALLPDRPPMRGRSLLRHPAVQKWRRPVTTESVPAATAAVVATRTGLLRAVPLPEEYFLYWEEIEWAWQLRRAHAALALVPGAVAVHSGGRDDVRPEKQRLLARNAVRCVVRTQGRARAAVAWPIVVAWQLRLLLTDLTRPRFDRRARVRARAAGVCAALCAWRELR